MRCGRQSRGLASLAAVVGSAAIFTVAGQLYFAAATGVDPPYITFWPTDQFALAYQDLGFVRRALPGTLLRAFAGEGPVAVLPLAVAAAAALAGALAVLIHRLADPFLAFAILVSPATFLQAGFDLGRIDHLNLLLLLAIVFSPRREAILLAPLMVPIHEGAVVLFLPIGFYCHWVRHGFCGVQVVSAVATALVFAILVATPGPDAAMLRQFYPGMHPQSVENLTGGIGDGLAFVIDYYAGRAPILYMGFVTALLYLVTVVAIARCYSSALPRAGLGLIGALAPLALLPVGINAARWIALASLNLFILALFARRGNPPSLPVARSLPVHLLLFAYALAGPLGVTFAFAGALEAWWRFATGL